MTYPTPAQIDVLAEIESAVETIPSGWWMGGVRGRYRHAAIADAMRPQVSALIARADAMGGRPCLRLFGVVSRHHWEFAVDCYALDNTNVYVCERCGHVMWEKARYG